MSLDENNGCGRETCDGGALGSSSCSHPFNWAKNFPQKLQASKKFQEDIQPNFLNQVLRQIRPKKTLKKTLKKHLKNIKILLKMTQSCIKATQLPKTSI